MSIISPPTTYRKVLNSFKTHVTRVLKKEVPRYYQTDHTYITSRTLTKHGFFTLTGNVFISKRFCMHVEATCIPAYKVYQAYTIILETLKSL